MRVKTALIKNPCPSDLTVIMEFARMALNDREMRHDMINRLDLSDDEAGRVMKVIDDYLDPPERIKP